MTQGELQVARLVVDRRTNPEIAAELFLSQKTVETHLRNIFRKIDVSSRVALARGQLSVRTTLVAQSRKRATTPSHPDPRVGCEHNIP